MLFDSFLRKSLSSKNEPLNSFQLFKSTVCTFALEFSKTDFAEAPWKVPISKNLMHLANL